MGQSVVEQANGKSKHPVNKRLLRLEFLTAFRILLNVRKRLVMGAIAVVVVGVAAYVLSPPKKGTVEWHKREYLSAYKGSWEQRTEKALNRFFGKPTSSFPKGPWDLIEHHQRALIGFGYLEQRSFALSNRAVDVVRTVTDAVLANLSADPRITRLRREFIFVTAPETNRIVVVATRDDMVVLAETIHKADAP